MKPQTGVGSGRKKMLKTVLQTQGGFFNHTYPKQKYTMDYLQTCAKAFERLLDVKYHIAIGRKGKLTELNILFDPTEFHHLIGLHKLHDLRLARGNREKIFRQILDGNLSMDDLKKSRYFTTIQKRMEPFSQIENLLDSNNLIFRYNQKLQSFSLIEAEYLLSTPYESTDVYIFLDQLPGPNSFFCRSFFPKEDTDYTKGQAVYTLLKKEKITLSTGKIQKQNDYCANLCIAFFVFPFTWHKS